MPRCLAIAVVLAASALATAAPAHGAGLGSLVMYSDPGDFVGAGRDYLFPAGRFSFGAQMAGERVEATAQTRDRQSVTLHFAPPEGRKLRRGGVYDHAQRWPFQELGRPGISVTGFGRGCNRNSGRFEVKDLVRSKGRIKRLWLVFEQHCEEGSTAIWGELRLGRPDHGGPALVDPAIVRWPLPAEGGSRRDVPVTVRARRKVRVRSAAVAGGQRAEFPVQSDGCSGTTLARGKRCRVVVRFAPSAPGMRTAVLKIADSSGRRHPVRLQGFTYGGRTRLVVNAAPGSGFGEPRTHEHTPADSLFLAQASPGRVLFEVQRPLPEDSSEWWQGSFGFEPGSGPPVNVFGSHGRCQDEPSGSFTAREARFDSVGQPRSLAIDFEQRCPDRTGALTGVLEWRAGDATPLPPWMRP